MKRHPFDPISFILGILVTGVGTAYALGVHSSAWVAPTVVGGIGIVFVTAAVVQLGGNRSRNYDEPNPSAS